MLPLWRSLHVPVGEFRCREQCTATLIPMPAREDAEGAYEIVRVQMRPSDPPFRFLVFRREPANAWTFRGVVDFSKAATDNCSVPKPSIEKAGDRPWLVFAYPKVCRGTGVGSREEQWFDLRAARLAHPLRIFSEGSDASGLPTDPMWKWKSQLTKIDREGRRETAYVHLEVGFYRQDQGSEGRRFSLRSALVAYTQGPNGVFRFDPSRSDAQAASLLKLCSAFANDRIARFLEYNMEELRGIAAGKSAGDQQWLRSLLSRSHPSKYKEELVALLPRS